MILAETKEKYQIGDNLNESVHLRWNKKTQSSKNLWRSMRKQGLKPFS
jgi:hypothetical protein